MSDQLPPCPECSQEFTYEQGALLVCPMCGHEWSASDAAEAAADAVVKDSVGNVLADGDTVTIVKTCLLYTSPSPRDATLSRMPSSA